MQLSNFAIGMLDRCEENPRVAAQNDLFWRGRDSLLDWVVSSKHQVVEVGELIPTRQKMGEKEKMTSAAVAAADVG